MSDRKLSRREFLRLTAATAAGAAALSAAPALGETFGKPPQQDAVTLRVAHAWDVVFLEHQNEWDKGFMERNPDIKIEVIDNTWSDHNQIVPTWAAANQLPDLLYVHGSRALPWSHEGLLVSLDTYVETDEEFNVDGIWDEALNLYKYKGVLYAIPYDHGPIILAYNKNLFDAAGVDYPTEEWTMDDLLETAIALTKGEEQWGFSGYGDDLMDLGNEYHVALLGPWGGETFNDDETELVLDSPESIEALKFWYDLIHVHKAAPALGQSQSFTGMGGTYIAGVSAMFALASWGTPQMHEFAAFEWDVAPWPAGPKGKKTGSFGSGYAITRDSQNPDAGWRYLREYLSVEGMEFMWGASGRGSPARAEAYQSWIDSEPAPDSAEYYLDALANYAVTGHPYKTLAGPEIMSICDRYEDLMETGEMSVEDAVAGIMEEAAPVLEAANEAMQ